MFFKKKKEEPKFIVGVCGYKRSGKDTIANRLVTKHKFFRRAFADPIKESCRILYGFDERQLNGDLKETVDPNWNISPRLAMQVLGSEMFRQYAGQVMPDLGAKVGDGFWIQRFKLWVLQNSDKKRIVVPDVRFRNEIQVIRDFGGLLIRVNRPGFKGDNHISETGLDGFTAYDYVIDNNGSFDKVNRQIDEIIVKELKKRGLK